MAMYLASDTEITSIADAIRTKGGTSSALVFPTDFVTAIQGIPSGTDVSDTTATAADVLSGKYFYLANGTRTEGTYSGGGGLSLVTQSGVTPTSYEEQGNTLYKLSLSGISDEPKVIYIRTVGNQKLTTNNVNVYHSYFAYNISGTWYSRATYGYRNVSYYVTENTANVDVTYSSGNLDIKETSHGFDSSRVYDVYLLS